MGKPQFLQMEKKNQLGTLHQNSSLKSMSKDKDQQSIYRDRLHTAKKNLKHPFESLSATSLASRVYN